MPKLITLFAIFFLFAYPLTVPLLHADGPGSIPTAPAPTATPERLAPTAEPVLYRVYVPVFAQNDAGREGWPLPY